jgi:hypothetical protein
MSRAEQPSQIFSFLGSLNPFGMSVVTPIAAKMLQCRERRDVPKADSCTAANNIAIQSPRRVFAAATIRFSFLIPNGRD